jgi:hypothetical protein
MIELNPAARLRAYRARQRPQKDRFLYRYRRPMLPAWAAAGATVTAAIIFLAIWAIRSI